jgi:hypothetical protein
MKAIVGRKYKLIASPSMFKDWVGQVFEVTNISKTEVDLKEADCSVYGCAYISVSQEEFPMYFELVADEIKKEDAKQIKKTRAGKWSDWKTFKVCGVTYAFKENGKNITVRSGGYRGTSKCHPEDEFDLEYGLRLAISRLIQNKNAEQKKREEYLAKKQKERTQEKRRHKSSDMLDALADTMIDLFF